MKALMSATHSCSRFHFRREFFAPDPVQQPCTHRRTPLGREATGFRAAFVGRRFHSNLKGRYYEITRIVDGVSIFEFRNFCPVHSPIRSGWLVAGGGQCAGQRPKARWDAAFWHELCPRQNRPGVRLRRHEPPARQHPRQSGFQIDAGINHRRLDLPAAIRRHHFLSRR